MNYIEMKKGNKTVYQIFVPDGESKTPKIMKGGDAIYILLAVVDETKIDKSPSNKITEEQENEIYKLNDEGMSEDVIAKALKISDRTVKRYLCNRELNSKGL